ncbi:transposon Ty3-I Gag-Pol polyprotein [Trichonephila clavipes]|uniref:Transposon Ty3-I Gag-Pol polyprotein n=1 Tax=Trichonephila clavipes TaxID=2585209 RepID=A0A8X6VB95_TRICX|nr:transposon Ty3-I Gag-Pol polyprotein [Trichonephila clavipes]
MRTDVRFQRVGKPVQALDATESPEAEILGRKSRFTRHDIKLCLWVTNVSTEGGVVTLQENYDLSTVNRALKVFKLFNSYFDLAKPNMVNIIVKHGVEHHIVTSGQLVYSKAGQLAPDKFKLVKQEFLFMLDFNIIRPYNI